MLGLSCHSGDTPQGRFPAWQVGCCPQPGAGDGEAWPRVPAEGPGGSEAQALAGETLPAAPKAHRAHVPFHD